MAFELATLGLAVDSRQVKDASRDLDKFADSADEAGGAATKMQREVNSALGPMRQMAQIAAAVGLALGVREMISYADTWKLIEGRLKLVTTSTAQLKATQQQLFNVSQQTRSSFESTSDLYIRVARNADQLNLSQQETMRFTELTSKAIQVGGASAQEAAGGITQLSQALATGRLMGDEFRSVIENLQGVAKFAGEGFRQMGMTTQTGVAALFELRDAGRLTAQDFIAAIQSMGDEIDKEFESIPRTVSQAMIQLENAFMRQIGLADEFSGITEVIARAIGDLANNLDDLTGFVVALSAALLVRAIPAIVATTNAIRAMTIAAAANPFGLMAVAIGYSVGLLYEFRDTTFEIAGATVRVGNIVNAVWVSIREVIKNTVAWIMAMVDALVSVATLDFDGASEALAKQRQEAQASAQAIVEAWSNLDANPEGIKDLQGLIDELSKNGENAAVGIRSFEESINGLNEQLAALDNGGVEAMKQVQDRLKAADELAKAGGRGDLDTITAQITKERQLTDLLKERVKAIEDAAQKQSETKDATTELQDQYDSYKLLIDRIKEAGVVTDEYRDKLEVQLEARREDIDITNGAGKAWYEAAISQRQAARELETLSERLSEGISLTEAMRTPLEEYKNALEEINELLAANAISEETATRARNRAAQEYEEAERRKKDASTDWADGAARAFEDYIDAATDAAQQTETVVTGAFRSMEDAFVGIITGTKSVSEAFADMVTSILEDLARMMVQQYITGPIAQGIFGSIFGGSGGATNLFGAFGGTTSQGVAGGVGLMGTIYHDGGVVGDGSAPSRMVASTAWAGAQKLHEGGFAANEVPIVALKGERVMTEAQQENTARTLEALSKMASSGSSSGSRGDVNVSVYNYADGTSARTEERQNASGGSDIDVIIEQVEESMGRRIQKGEGLAPTLEGKYALNPAAGAVR